MSKSLADAIAESIGANDEQQEVEHWLDTGFPPLNKAISGRYDGGMPAGRIVEMFGPPSSGKTAIATMVMKAAQEAGGIAAFMDHENSFDIGQGIALGLSIEPHHWVYKQPETFEASVDTIVKLARRVRGDRLIPDEAPIVAVFDSLASMVPQSKFFDSKGNERESGTYNMHDNTALARCTSASFPALSQYATKFNILLLFLNQIRTKPGVAYGDPTTTPGGQAPEFYASVRISLTRQMLKAKDGDQMLGQITNANVKKNKVSRPFEKASWRFMFRDDGTGHFDVTTSTLEYAKEKGLIETSGAYLVWTDGKKYHLATLAKKIDDEGLQAELRALLKDD